MIEGLPLVPSLCPQKPMKVCHLPVQVVREILGRLEGRLEGEYFIWIAHLLALLCRIHSRFLTRIFSRCSRWYRAIYRFFSSAEIQSMMSLTTFVKRFRPSLGYSHLISLAINSAFRFKGML